MAGLWTPESGSASAGGDRHDDRHTELADELAAMQAELARTPAAVVVSNHAIGLFQLAAIHLNQRPPNLPEGRLAIDAFAGLVDATEGRLGDEEGALREALGQIRLAFVRLTQAASDDAGPDDDADAESEEG